MFWQTPADGAGNGVRDREGFSSYPELWRLGDELVATAGCEGRVLVALLVENSALGIAAYLGFLRAGHVIFLGDPRQSPEQVQRWIERFRPEVVLTRAESPVSLSRSDFAESWVQGARLHISTRRRGEKSAKNPALHRDLALLLATSGSTGEPRMVRSSYRALQANAEAIARSLAIAPGDRAVTSLPMCYAYGLSVVDSHLARGASIVCTERGVGDPAFWRLVREHRCTSVAGVPFHYQLMHAMNYWDSPAPTVHTYTQAGGPLDPGLQRHHLEQAERRGARFVVMYGQTEAKARISHVPPGSLASHLGSIGVAIPGGRLTLSPLEGHGADEGELVYQGPNVMMGYATGRACLGRGDELGGLLRTGDVARRGPDGFYWLIGRLTRFIKPFGVRVSLDELERSVAQQAGRQAVAVGNDEGITVFIAGERSDSDSDSGPDSVVRRLTAALRLPADFVRCVTLDSIPRDRRGKIDMSALLALTQRPRDPREDVTASLSAIEERIARVWSDVLGATEIDVHASFFDLGGDSLRAIDAMSRVRDAGLECDVSAIFATPTVAGLARRIHERRDADRAKPPAPARPRRRGGESATLSANQRMHWALHRRRGATAAYNLPVMLGLEGPLEVAALEAAVGDLVERHDILRTRYGFIAGRLGQQVTPGRGDGLRVVDDAVPGDRDLGALATREASRPFDLRAGPVVRFTLIRRGPGRHALILVFHHIACDGWSIEILLDELAALYNARVLGAVSPSPPVIAHHANLATIRGQDDARARSQYWRSQLADAPERLDLPTDFPRTSRPGALGRPLPFALDEDLTERLRALARMHGATLYMTLLGALHIALWHHSGQTDMVIGSPYANRPTRETRSMIGCLTTTLLIRSPFDPARSFAAFLDGVRSTVAAGLRHAPVPFEEIASAVEGSGLRSRAWFQVLFVLQSYPEATTSFNRLRSTRLPIASDRARCDLMVVMRERATTLQGSWAYQSDLYAEETARDMLRSWQRALRAVCDAPDQPVRSLNLGGAGSPGATRAR